MGLDVNRVDFLDEGISGEIPESLQKLIESKKNNIQEIVSEIHSNPDKYKVGNGLDVFDPGQAGGVPFSGVSVIRPEMDIHVQNVEQVQEGIFAVREDIYRDMMKNALNADSNAMFFAEVENSEDYAYYRGQCDGYRRICKDLNSFSRKNADGFLKSVYQDVDFCEEETSVHGDIEEVASYFTGRGDVLKEYIDRYENISKCDNVVLRDTLSSYLKNFESNADVYRDEARYYRQNHKDALASYYLGKAFSVGKLAEEFNDVMECEPDDLDDKMKKFIQNVRGSAESYGNDVFYYEKENSTESAFYSLGRSDELRDFISVYDRNTVDDHITFNVEFKQVMCHVREDLDEANKKYAVYFAKGDEARSEFYKGKQEGLVFLQENLDRPLTVSVDKVMKLYSKDVMRNRMLLNEFMKDNGGNEAHYYKGLLDAYKEYGDFLFKLMDKDRNIVFNNSHNGILKSSENHLVVIDKDKFKDMMEKKNKANEMPVEVDFGMAENTVDSKDKGRC